ncbi:hypothetical protein GH714_015018 [Hevea brasiliensis]|uniref:CCHC-type domain-containing protein n=1 Tax=Hevea brasiliensis TaxID=3981 RepID=A0A6A6M7A4_HEVBR|nr:hypothetical protein GH714_015018 [Hevea brasiliensis]
MTDLGKTLSVFQVTLLFRLETGVHFVVSKLGFIGQCCPRQLIVEAVVSTVAVLPIELDYHIWVELIGILQSTFTSRRALALPHPPAPIVAPPVPPVAPADPLTAIPLMPPTVPTASFQLNPNLGAFMAQVVTAAITAKPRDLHHKVECIKFDKGCFECGAPGRLKRNCPLLLAKDNVSEQGSIAPESVQIGTTAPRGRSIIDAGSSK